MAEINKGGLMGVPAERKDGQTKLSDEDAYQLLLRGEAEQYTGPLYSEAELIQILKWNIQVVDEKGGIGRSWGDFITRLDGITLEPVFKSLPKEEQTKILATVLDIRKKAFLAGQ